LLLVGGLTAQQVPAQPLAPLKADDLFQISRIWDVHLTFSRDA
jgi:hypothetical protein